MQIAQKNPQNDKSIKSQISETFSDTQKEQEQNIINDCYEFLASSADCKLIKQLDLESFFADFATFLARKKPMYLNGDLAVYKKMIDELDLAFCDSIHLPQIPRVDLLEPALMHLNKNGNLHLSQIYNISKILGYFCTLQKHIQKNSQIPAKSTLKEWIEKIIFPPNLLESLLIFTQNGEIKDGIFPQIDSIKSSISNVASSIKSEFSALLNSKHLESYLVDKQVHFIYECQTLLLKAGFSKALNGNILERTQSGYFYVLPSAIARLYERQNSLRDSLEVEIANIAKNLSILLKKHILFLRFIDKEFDKFDLLQARLNFAKSKNLEFILPYVASQKKAKQAKDISSFYSDSLKIILHDFCHPILANPKPTNIVFDKGALILTGVNAGGKTMLLKSILSAVFLAKLLMPMKINPHKSRIPHFRQIAAIISDPQNTKNDISTFAGRMLEFSQNLGRENMLLGIDEIELGTDADEASSLYQILLDEILKRGNKIVLTTHHKRLASLMAGDSRVQMSAALFDVNLGKPLFDFLHGSIGKSYAFESAERYGIPTLLVERARKHYGEDKERLNELIEQSSKLEIELKSKQEQAQKELENLQKKSAQYDELIIALQEKFAKKEMVMERAYKEALDTLKQKANTMSEAHRNINTAHKILESFYAQDDESDENAKNARHTKARATNATNPKSSYKKGDTIKYNGKRGKILEIHSKHFLVELDSGMRLKVDFAKANEKSHSNLLPTHKLQKDSSKSVATKGYTLELAHSGASPSLDLHGFRVEEAIEAMEDFISQSLVAGFDEVAICHGLGGGVLARVTREFLSTHPKVVSFCDAPPKLGGIGTQIVRL
ncbi:endonuclease MutS2 [Helicobacter macacae]|uniref:Endonuclease MutS2 n=1 Tax=Helicobacter macacae MIT 99-5501 TaxID=1357400 RepID=V8CCQ2_9HELI|nr:Smr/MutS family protein [Helicobacter macacae]ETD25134.1 hypothetical protein HMPREF2086_00469 [Helicobacter macacae MIT 99-5501]